MTVKHDNPMARLACAGWAIPREVAGQFPGEGSHLERYARVFGAVEINSTFYKPHLPKTFERWAASVPGDFRFSLKLPRTITHEQKLLGAAPLLERFAEQCSPLGEKLGCVLVQLPPKQGFDAGLAETFFGQLREAFGCMLACEARHESWFREEATAMLAREGITRVIADPPAGQRGPHIPTTKAIYTRLHGAPRVYYSSYEPAYLAQLAQDMRTHAAAGRQVWCIFDNTASGAAMANALAVRAS
jgi:uncharacterized protein YecE (DUF72 family)